MSDEEVHELAMDQRSLFPIPVWTVDLTGVFGSKLDDMAATAARYIDSNPAEAPFEQSRAGLESVPDGPWPQYHQVLGQICGGILAGSWPMATYEIARMATWGLRMHGPSGGGTLHHLHAHPRALLSSVLYLRVPDELVDTPWGGTVFRDPNAANTGYMVDRPLSRVPAAPLRLVVFPGWLEHTPAEPPDAAPYSSLRLVVATDVICV